MSSRALKYLLNKALFYCEVRLNVGKAEFSHGTEVTVLVYKKLNWELAGLDSCSPQPHRWTKMMVSVGFFRVKLYRCSSFEFSASIKSNTDAVTCKHIISWSFLGGQTERLLALLLASWDWSVPYGEGITVESKTKQNKTLKL